MELQTIQKKIYEIRGKQVMLDFDLALLYGVETSQLKRSVRRNIERFEGEDFMFEVTKEELSRCQIGTLNKGRGTNIKYLPFAFTEHGVIMLASVLRNELAVQASIQITRAFVSMRNYILSTRNLEAELVKLRSRLELLEKNNEDNLGAINDLSEDVSREIDNIYMAIAALSARSSQQPSPDKPIKKIGFK